MIPELVLDGFAVTAKIDYVQVFCEVRLGDLPGLAERCNWTRNLPNEGWLLTVHDASRRDIDVIVRELQDPPMTALEVAVDFKLGPGLADVLRQASLATMFSALAARFRPEDNALFGAGFKGGFSGRGKPSPFHRRLPRPSESLVYGHRGEGQNAKLYFKQQDAGVDLAPSEWSVRLEVTMYGPALFEYGVREVSGLYGFGFRKKLAKSFRIVDRAAVRYRKQRSDESAAELSSLLSKAWSRAGVNALFPPTLPPDASKFARDAVAGRKHQLLPIKGYRLVRHAAAHLLIGNALRQLDRRMASRISGGSD